MSHQKIRLAATILRERANAATPGPWDAYADGKVLGVGQNRVAENVASWNQPYLGTVSPDFAHAVADALDIIAYVKQYEPESDYMDTGLSDPSLRLAELILGDAG